MTLFFNSIALINKIEPMLNDNDTDCIDLIDEISVVPGTEELVSHLEDFNFKKALEELKALKKGLVANHE